MGVIFLLGGTSRCYIESMWWAWVSMGGGRLFCPRSRVVCTPGQRGNFGVFGGAALRQGNELIFASKLAKTNSFPWARLS